MGAEIRLTGLRAAALVLACIGLLVLASSSFAATPSVALKGALFPLSGYPEPTPSMGTALQVELAFSGAGYGATPQMPGGGVPPLASLELVLPEGMKMDLRDFDQCGEVTLENVGPSGCPRGASAGPERTGRSEVSFGSERVPEEVTLRPFIAAGGNLLLFVQGSTPVALEYVSRAEITTAAAPPNILRMKTSFPAIATVPGAPLASARTLALELGPATNSTGKTEAYLALPETCPAGGFPLKAELFFGGSFGGEREFGIPGEAATAITHVPCPSRVPAPLIEVVPGTDGIVTAPSNKTCVSNRDFRIHVLQIHDLVYRRVQVAVNGRPVKVLRGRRASAQVDLRGLPRGRYTVRITVTTTSGRRISGMRAYHTCARRKLPGGNPRL
ncbi:MAG TPA: hypothetical protein VMB05_04090 [Solirubrobacteraceae bacterium]|nr:hypothetical protein [Solirubrobacteraceae bacterium]